MTAPAHCPLVNGPMRAGSGAGCWWTNAFLPGKTVCWNGSGVETSTAWTAPDAGISDAPTSSEPGSAPGLVVPTPEPVEGAITAEAAAVVPAGGHGSPPGVRGRPRRRASPDPDAVAAAPAAPASIPEPVEGLDAGAAAGSVASTGSATAEEAVGAAPTGAASAGGHGSPPGVRGRPRRRVDASTGSAVEAAGAAFEETGSASDPTGAATDAAGSAADATGSATGATDSATTSSVAASAAGASPAGGHGSPPATLGSPRLSAGRWPCPTATTTTSSVLRALR